jgi:hypothetical protein
MYSLFSIPFLMCVSLVISVGNRFLPTNVSISKRYNITNNTCLTNMHISPKAKCILPVYVQKDGGKEYSDDIEPICRSVL